MAITGAVTVMLGQRRLLHMSSWRKKGCLNACRYVSFHHENKNYIGALSSHLQYALWTIHKLCCYCLLTHWGRVTHICVTKLTIIGSDNGLSPGRRQAIIWTNAGILLIEPLGTNFSEILIGIQSFSFKKMRLKMSSAKWRPFCLGLNVLNKDMDKICLYQTTPKLWLGWVMVVMVVISCQNVVTPGDRRPWIEVCCQKYHEFASNQSSDRLQRNNLTCSHVYQSSTAAVNKSYPWYFRSLAENMDKCIRNMPKIVDFSLNYLSSWGWPLD